MEQMCLYYGRKEVQIPQFPWLSAFPSYQFRLGRQPICLLILSLKKGLLIWWCRNWGLARKHILGCAHECTICAAHGHEMTKFLIGIQFTWCGPPRFTRSMQVWVTELGTVVEGRDLRRLLEGKPEVILMLIQFHKTSVVLHAGKL